MDLEQAIKERIRKYYDKNHDEEGMETNKLTPAKYTREYFDKFEEEILGSKEVKK